jgi:2-oxo-4-hydroxy-4-carboxy-5-ureidoimidazoline decarboxylase
MNVSVAELDRMPAARATELLSSCCGSARWVERMVALRPFGSSGAMRTAADETWRALEPRDWREAFSHHPRIGERLPAVPQGERGMAWSASEQAGVDAAAGDVRQQLARANREYEERFGYVYIVFASGRTADEMLALCRARLANDPETEIAVAAEEQRRIMQLRLSRLTEGDASETRP